MSEMEKLAQYFTRFPGIGTRQARRFVYFLLASNPAYVKDLSARMLSLLEKSAQCADCRRYFEHTNGGRDTTRVCDMCADTASDPHTLVVVEKDADLLSFKKSGGSLGRFFVLGALIPLSEIKGAVVAPRVKELKGRIEKAVASGLKEVLLALSATPEGDHTALELRILLEPLQKKHGFTVSALGRGLSTGSELEYADGETIKSAFENRKTQ